MSVYEQHHIVSPDIFLGINQMGSYLNTKGIMEQLKNTSIGKNSVVELMCHPGELSD